MLSLVMLSVGTAFASDDIADVVAADDEIAIDESLAVGQDAQEVSADEAGSQLIITPENVGDYIDESGKIKENVTADELVFNGAFENLNLTVERSITVTGGDNSSFKNPNIQVYASNVILQKLDIVQEKGVNSIVVGGLDENTTTSDVSISDVDITFFDDQSGAGAIPIQVMNSDNFVLKDSIIAYVGKTDGYYLNNAIRVVNSRNAEIHNNKISAELISVPVGWSEEPAGSGQWVSSPMSEAVVIKDCENATFDSNNVTVLCTNASGSYDTIYAVDVTGSGAIVANNNIIANGNSYIYGLIVSGDDFIIRANDIKSTGVYYANGIDIEGPATGVVEDNNINVESESSAYGIYSGMNGQDVSASYSGNNISGSAYNIFGMSVGDVNANVSDSFIDLEGNYTTGIAYRGSNLTFDNNSLLLISSEEGNESIWEGFGVEAVGVKVIKGTAVITNNVITTAGKGLSLNTNETFAYLGGNTISVIGNDDKDAFAIYAINPSELVASENVIAYLGDTAGTGINNAVYVNSASTLVLDDNRFDLALVSCYVPWAEVPAGSGNWVSSPVSEGIVIENSDYPIISNNEINVEYIDVVGDYDTIYAVDLKNSDNALVSFNDITATGNTYIYGIIATGENLDIHDNNITSVGNYYANGIDIEGPATGVVENNKIDVKAETSAYAIYSGMNGANVSAKYANNKIDGNAYNVFGFSLGDVESNLVDNTVLLEGNYTTGIAYRGSVLTVVNNTVAVFGTNVGNESIWEGFGVETVGIKVVMGNATIADNYVYTTANYTIDVKDTASSVHDNYLYSQLLLGDESVMNEGNAEVYYNYPVVKSNPVISITEVDGDLSIAGVLKDAKGNVLSNATINYASAEGNGTVITDENGTFKISDLANGQINLTFDGDFYNEPANATITLKDIIPSVVKVESQFNITGGVITLNGYAVDTKAGEEGIYYATELLDANGNPIKDAKIQFAVNNKIYNRTTNENGSFNPYKLNMKRAGRYTMAFYFAGNDNYTGAFASVCVDLDKKPIKIKASAKSYKAATKTKKYTVTLSTKVCSSHDGKAHLRTGLKVTLTVNGKTYTGKTNSKGQVTFKITNLSKKAKYKAKVSYEGDATYDSASKTVTLTVN